jgi:hypothetical protein
MANKFKEKQITAEILEELYNIVENKEKDASREYKVIGKEDRQAKDWRTGEPKWEDEAHTIPIMEDKWGYVDKAELTEDDEIRIKICQHIKSQLEKMI